MTTAQRKRRTPLRQADLDTARTQLAAERAMEAQRKAARPPRQPRRPLGEKEEGWVRLPPHLVARFAQEEGFLVAGFLYLDRLGPARVTPEGRVSRPVITYCAGRWRDLVAGVSVPANRPFPRNVFAKTPEFVSDRKPSRPQTPDRLSGGNNGKAGGRPPAEFPVARLRELARRGWGAWKITRALRTEGWQVSLRTIARRLAGLGAVGRRARGSREGAATRLLRPAWVPP